MNKRIQNQLYAEDICTATSCEILWEKLSDKNILIVGATGMIGTFLIDMLVYLKEKRGLNLSIFAMGRDEENSQQRFSDYLESDRINFICHDINQKFDSDIRFDYIIHAASNTHPNAYASDPIGTITSNVFGTYNLLEYMKNVQGCRLLLISSVEVYGQSRDGTEIFKEDYCGYIDCNTLRAGYPESKRVSEALCQAYISQKNSDVVILRLSRVYGSTMRLSDSKAMSQFILKAVAGEDIIMKSEGTQRFSYCYVADAATAVMYTLLFGKCGEAYNAADDTSENSLREIARFMAETVGKSVIFDLPDEIEAKGFSTAMIALLNCEKLYELGWEPRFTLKEGLVRTIKIMKERMYNEYL